MGSEYFINSQELENKVRDLLPSQGGAGAGFDLSASTQIVPIIDLTESAEGSNIRQDLQKSFSFTSSSAFNVSNTTTNIISNTGYYRVFGNIIQTGGTGSVAGSFELTDGASFKSLIAFETALVNSIYYPVQENFDFLVFLEAGEILQAFSNSTNIRLRGTTRQIASIDGTLTNP